MKSSLLKLTLVLAVATSALSLPASAQTVPAAANDVAPLKIGLKLPDISLSDEAGNLYPLTKSLTNGPAILVFYRGGWCPYCNTQLAGLAQIQPELLKMGYRIFAISPDTPADLAKTSGKHKLQYKLLSDTSMQASRALGLAFRVDDATVSKYKEYGIDLSKSNNMLPVPAVYIVGTDGVVDFSYVNPDYKTRVPGELILAAAKIFAPTQ